MILGINVGGVNLEDKIIIKALGKLSIKTALYCIGNIIDDTKNWNNDCAFTFKNHYETIIIFGKKNKGSITFTCYYEGDDINGT